MNLIFNPHMAWIMASAVFVYWALLKTHSQRDIFIFYFSLSVLLWLHPLFALMGGLVTVICLQWARHLPGKKMGAIWLGLLGIVTFWMAMKYGPGLLRAWATPTDWVGQYLVVPMGISYLCVRLIQYLLESYRGVYAEHSLYQLGAYLFFIPTLPAGPIEGFRSFYGNRGSHFSADFLGYGTKRMLWGYFKKLCIGDLVLDSLSRPWVEAVTVGPVEELRLTQVYVFCVFMFVRAYVDLSAYTDIAIGCARLFGFQLSENFSRPFLKANLAEFWRGWHITLANWCRDNVYYPILVWCRKPVLALFGSMIFMGLWHHVHWNWLCWGLFHATGLAMLVWLGDLKNRFPQLGRIMASPWMRPVFVVLTFTYVAWGYLFVSISDLGRTADILAQCWMQVGRAFSA